MCPEIKTNELAENIVEDFCTFTEPYVLQDCWPLLLVWTSERYNNGSNSCESMSLTNRGLYLQQRCIDTVVGARPCLGMVEHESKKLCVGGAGNTAKATFGCLLGTLQNRDFLVLGLFPHFSKERTCHERHSKTWAFSKGPNLKPKALCKSEQ